MAEEEPFGTTAIPPSSTGGGSVEVTLDLWSHAASTNAQQPQTQQIAVYEPKPNEDCINGSLLDVNQHFVVYAVKNGLIRVLHRASAMRALLRGHQGQLVTDISFFSDGDVLATVGHSLETGISTLIVWRVFEQSPEIQSEKLLEVSSDAAQMSRLLWHPFNPNQVWVIHSMGKPSDAATQQAATLVETTRIQTATHPEESHPVCHWSSPYAVMEGAVQLNLDGGALADLAYSGRDTRHVLSVHSNGKIVLWDLKQTEDFSDPTTGAVTQVPKQLVVISESTPQSRALFLPHENAHRLEGQTDTITSCFVTASEQNTVITLWSSFTSNPGTLPVKLQVLKLSEPSPSYVLDLCFGPAPQDASPPSCFLLWADRHKGQLQAVHIASQWNGDNKALCVGADYVVPFALKHPIYSWCIVCAPTVDISEEDIAEHQGLIFDMKLFSYQSKLVQCLTLTSYMCLPPEHAYTDPTPGVIVADLEDNGPTITDLDDIEPEYDEDYDVEDDEEETEEAEAPQASTLPAPAGGSANPFANWLGAIAGTAPAPSSDVPMPPQPEAKGLPVPPGLPTPPPGLSNGTAEPLLNPLDLIANNEDTNKPAGKPKNKEKKGRSKSPKGNKNKSANPFPDGNKISILKREDKSQATPPPATSSIPIPPPADPAIIPMPPPVDPAVISMVPPAGAVADPNLEATLARVVSAELSKQPAISEAIEKAMVAKLVPEVKKVVQDSLSSFGRPLQSSVDRLGQQGIRVDAKDLQTALDVETPIKAAMADVMRNVFIPTMESITAGVLQKVTPPRAETPQPDKATMGAIEALAKQLAAMNAKMDAMSNELRSLRAQSVPDPPMPPLPTPAAPAPNAVEAARSEIVALLQQKNYQAAFTKAVSTNNVDMTVFVCSRADMAEVIGGNAPKLSQPILLCVLQQLGAALLTTNAPEILNLELEWLQELALTLNPADPNIQRHVPKILQQVVGCVNQKMTQGDPQFKRPLQILLKVLRGM